MSEPQESQNLYDTTPSKESDSRPTLSESETFETSQASYDPVRFLSKSLSQNEMTSLLDSKWAPKPEKGRFSFPVTSGRRYNVTWEDTYKWLRYSPSMDAAFCAPCIAFTNTDSGRAAGDKLVSSGLKDWKNVIGSKRGAFKAHEESNYHQDALIKASHFMKVQSGEDKSIKSKISKTYEDTVKRNREIIMSIIDVVIVLGQRNIPFRGHSWDKITKQEDGNFDCFVRWKAEDKPILKTHLVSAAYNAKYMSPDIQNELIELAGQEVLDTILERAKAAKFFSVMADECTDVANLEQMAICIRFAEESNVISEEFIGFVALEKVDAASITRAILNKLAECNLDVKNLRGQGYDGASVMSGVKSGVCTRICEVQPLAEYHHCRAHALNLVISSSCKSVDMIRNLFDDVNQLTWFLGGSPKRCAILKRYFPDAKQLDYLVGDTDQDVSESNKNIAKAFSKTQLPKLCETRWSARIDTLSIIIAKYKAVISSLEDVQKESTVTEAKTKARAFINMMEKSNFIVSLVVAHHILSFTKPLSLALQNSKCDVFKAFNDAQTCIKVVQDQRTDEVFHRSVWEKATAIADSLEIELTKPRTTGRMRHRENAEAVDAESYYKINTFFPFADHCLNELRERFSDKLRPSFLAFKLVPCKISDISADDVTAIKTRFHPDLPNEMGFTAEFERWKVLCQGLPVGSDKQSLSAALALADSEYYPNIHTIFLVLLTMPVGSVPCERSFSAMRRLKDWSRSTMTEDRLVGLSLMYIHRDVNISRESVLLRFSGAKDRRIGPLNF